MAEFIDFETLKLVKAFQKIRDLESRRIIISIVEAASQGAAVTLDEPGELEVKAPPA